jgi:festuclavine dehydrogenase
VQFDWSDPATYERPFEKASISAVFLVAPSIIDPFAPMKIFIDLAIKKGAKRLVLLSASLMNVGDGPMVSKVSKYISFLNIDYAILRPTWFMGISPRGCIEE